MFILRCCAVSKRGAIFDFSARTGPLQALQLAILTFLRHEILEEAPIPALKFPRILPVWRDGGNRASLRDVVFLS